MTQISATKPLAGWRVLVPRGGAWGEAVASALRDKGAVPVVSPLVNFAPTTDQEALDSALSELSAGAFDWLTVTSTTTVDVLFAHGVQIPDATKVAAVGETTATALQAAGYRVDLIAANDNSAQGLAEQLISVESEPRRILSLSSESAKTLLPEMLRESGHDVRSVSAYRMVGLPVSERVSRDVLSGRINSILITGPAVATQVREQFPKIPGQTLVLGVGPVLAGGKFGLSDHEDGDSGHDAMFALIDAVARFALPHAVDEFPL